MTTFRTDSSQAPMVVNTSVTPSSSSGTTALVRELRKTAKEYISKERSRLENEAASLKAILNGRTGGKGIQATSTAVVSAVAKKDIKSYLAGK